MTDQKTLTFLHTSESHVARFDRLIENALPDYAEKLRVRHFVNEALLPADGKLTDDIKRQAFSIMMQLAGSNDLVMCTCSTIAPVADLTAEMVDGIIMRVDRPMAKDALGHGDKILVAACLSSTVAPTQKLLLEAADEQNSMPLLTPLLIENAWDHFLAGDDAAYANAITDAIVKALHAGTYDAVLLAQASMDVALKGLTDCGVPVVSSPQSGVRAALKALGIDHS